MKIQSVSFINPKSNVYNSEKPRNSAYITNTNNADIFVKSAPVQVTKSNLRPISFMGYTVHIADGGEHAQNMNHFAYSISNKWDLYNKEVETNRQDRNVKQLENLEWKLKEINFENDLSYDKYHDYAYIAVPVLANVPLQNLEAQMNAVMGTNTSLTPQNIKTKKAEVMNFLKLIYDNPNKYREYINYMDPMGQGIEKAWGVITQLNRLSKRRHTKVFVPAGHPEFASIKWLTEQKNLKPELYNFIATKNDVNDSIANVRREISQNGWYDFNLLALSDAEIVNLKDTNGKDDYIYSAYDSCVSNGARGVYNFTPVRDKDGNIKGYSYHNNEVVDYPYDEFPANHEIQNIAKFVGRPLREVLADGGTTQAFKDAVWNNHSRDEFSEKLFRVSDIFPEEERAYNKMYLQGDYVDSSLQLFFRENDRGQIIYPNCDCEGSGRPSVLSMWGSCFSVFNAIKDDIALKERFNERGYYDKETLYTKHPQEVKRFLKESEELIQDGRLSEAEHILQYAVDLEKVAGLHGFRSLEALGDLYTLQQRYPEAESCYNTALNELSRLVLEKMQAADEDTTLEECFYKNSTFESLQKKNAEYIYQKEMYDRQGYLQKMFMTEPQKPESSEGYRKYAEIYHLAIEAPRLFEKLAKNCEERNEDYPAFACNWAADQIGGFDPFAEKLFKRRADNNTYLGDLLNVD